MNGLLDGNLTPLGDYLRSVGRDLPAERGGVLLMAANMIAGRSAIEGRRIVIADDKRAKSWSTRNGLLRIGRFERDKTAELGGRPQGQRAVEATMKEFAVSERTVRSGAQKWKAFFGEFGWWIEKHGPRASADAPEE